MTGLPALVVDASDPTPPYEQLRRQLAELVGAGAAAKEIHSGAGDAALIVRVDPRQVPQKGETIWVAIRPGERHAFSAASGARINA